MLERAKFYEMYPEQIDDIEMTEDGLKDYKAFIDGNDCYGVVLIEYANKTVLYTYNDGPLLNELSFPSLEDAIEAYPEYLM